MSSEVYLVLGGYFAGGAAAALLFTEPMPWTAPLIFAVLSGLCFWRASRGAS